MRYYLGLFPSGSTALWCADDAARTACRGDGAQETVIVPDGIGPLEAIKVGRENWSFHELDLRPGEYYPRMSRPNAQHLSESPGSNPANHAERPLIEMGRGQLMALRYQLENIFRTVHPVAANFNVFGHDIRNLLILASTEVEAHWKGVLAANGVRGKNSHDYVKLADPLKLKEYAVRLPFYPWLEAVRPFDRWVPSCNPTKDLGWYDAYQAVKHDRENDFNRATLVNALHAVCGCAVMLFAQFGTTGFHYRAEINSFFELAETPVWHLSETYSRLTEGLPYNPVRFPFSA
jgi:hypothetical protein